MFSMNPAEYLSANARKQLSSTASDNSVISDGFVSTFTPFSRTESEQPSSQSNEVVASMRDEIANALDRLDVIVGEVLEERKRAEKAAFTWIMIGGAATIILVIAAVLSPFLAKQQVLSSVFSSLSIGGLLLLLYSPVRETLTIANDRSNLILMVQGFRLRFAAADSVEQLQELASELTATLQFENRKSSHVSKE
ncbi:hypothetical protein IWQ49_000900 [Labrenzia sp. EL_126]|nr:hypothetical protein [Labrenzia sp. EL_126]